MTNDEHLKNAMHGRESSSTKNRAEIDNRAAMKSLLRRWLYLPLPVAILVFLWISCHYREAIIHGLFLNLAADCVVILFSALVVKRVWDRHEELKWRPVAEEVDARIADVATACVFGVAIAFPELSLAPVLRKETPDSMRNLSRRRQILSGFSRKEIRPRLFVVDTSCGPDLGPTARTLRAASDEADRVMSTFANRMDERATMSLVRIQNKAREFVRQHQFASEMPEGGVAESGGNQPTDRQIALDLLRKAAPAVLEELLLACEDHLDSSSRTQPS